MERNLNIKNIVNKILFEERDGGEFGDFEVEVGESEGTNIPHIHLNNGEKGKKQKKTAIRLDMNRYFIHGDKTYRLNSGERKQFVEWLKSPVTSTKNPNKKGEPPKSNYENLINIWNNYYNQEIKQINIDLYLSLLLDYKE